jgi:hypothetical protein
VHLFQDFSDVHSEKQAVVALKEMKQWKHEIVEDYYDKFLQLCAIKPQQLDGVYLRETFKEGLRNKLKLSIIGMLRATIVEVVNSAREIEKEMPTTCQSRRSQRLSNNEDSNEKSTNDEQKKERKKGHKERDDGY